MRPSRARRPPRFDSHGSYQTSMSLTHRGLPARLRGGGRPPDLTDPDLWVRVSETWYDALQTTVPPARWSDAPGTCPLGVACPDVLEGHPARALDGTGNGIRETAAS